MKKLSKEEYVKNHHDFWMTLHETGSDDKITACEAFCRERDIGIPEAWCFLCEEMSHRDPKPTDCPGNCLGNWEADTCLGKDSLFKRWENATTVEERRMWALKIANCCKKEITLSDKGKANIIQFMERQFQNLEKAKNTFTGATSDCKNIDEAMEAKKEYLLAYLDLFPINPEACPFCVTNSTRQNGIFLHCDRCLYKEKHGCCLNDGSSYDKISKAWNDLQDLIDDEYWKGLE